MVNALGRSQNTITTRARGLEYSHGQNGARRYRLADVLPTIKPKEREHVPALFELAQDDGEQLWTGDNAVPRVRRLEGWLKGEQLERAFGSRVSFTNSLAASVRSSLIFSHLEALRLTVILTDSVLKWTVLGDANALPPFEHWAVSYAITNARPNEIENEMRVAA
ncbi:hypothetical protein [Ruegeria atlantica]|uniref:hypothetical protein n=1 Tax=Ruegeria atlantica TaxID=81569 RepID=UPI0024943B95|nr:hypothetical protein [Ruegeria atlantica]